MTAELYLDTARLGRMCPAARKAEHDFAKLASQLGSSLYLERFLTDGFHSLPTSLQRQHAGLSVWPGISRSKLLFNQLLGLRKPAPTYYFSQSSTFIKFAAKYIFNRTQTVLTTDLAWPPYLDALRRAAVANRKNLVVVPLRQQMLEDDLTCEGVVSRIERAYREFRCDGVFLSVISYLGVNLPLRQVLHRLRRQPQCRLVVLDGAQAVGQRPIRVTDFACDLFLASTQKWLGSYHPLRVAVFPRHQAPGGWINVRLKPATSNSNVEDELFQFTTPGSRKASGFGETVNVLPLITAAASVSEALHPGRLAAKWKHRRQNYDFISQNLTGTCVRAIRLPQQMRAGILLIKNRVTSGAFYREALLRSNIVTSGFDGITRLSMLDRPLSSAESSELTKSLEKTQLAYHLRPHRWAATSGLVTETPLLS